ncbi:MAG TPA: cob(I)yrinic acid a,c-diamide adenosyltransferase [Bacteroidia bacterium]|nr:cob(I)yrinic acid a,c-diamide adenosyltransferase [Bacteroidia bacterium]
MKIYTKTGDTGKTSLIGGTRVPKHHLRIETYGTVDELNSYIGMIKDLLDDSRSGEVLKEIQDRLFTIGSMLASDPEKSRMKLPDLLETDIFLLEKEIDRMNETLPELKSFILPGGHPNSSWCHLARCVCRRCERLVSHLAEDNSVEPLVLIYLNRLSDYLFVLSRMVLLTSGNSEIPWKPRL